MGRTAGGSPRLRGARCTRPWPPRWRRPPRWHSSGERFLGSRCTPFPRRAESVRRSLRKRTFCPGPDRPDPRLPPPCRRPGRRPGVARRKLVSARPANRVSPAREKAPSLRRKQKEQDVYEFQDPAARELVAHVLDTQPEAQSLLAEAGHRRMLAEQSARVATEAFAMTKSARVGYEALRHRLDPRYWADHARRGRFGGAGHLGRRSAGPGSHRVRRGPGRVDDGCGGRHGDCGLGRMRLAGGARHP